MKPIHIKFLLVFFFFTAPYFVSAQDRILTMQGEEILCKVKEIDTGSIYYVKADTSAKPVTYSSDMQEIRITEVFMIKYINGSKDVFSQNLPDENKKTTVKDDNISEIDEKSYAELYELGRQDAQRNYKATTPFLIGGLCGITFGYGLIPAAVIAAVPPKPTVQTTSEPNLLYNPSYNTGFKNKAHGKKALNVAGGYVVGIVADVLIAIMIFGL